jgi:deazaflavin-dependent oxidoreductase (nitroreductase family)
MGLRETLTDTQMKTMNFLHKAMLKVSGGRIGNTAGSMPVVELHVVGRKSGKTRTTMLTSPLQEDGNYVLVASKGGDDRHPEWYNNLAANPDVELVTGDGETLQVTARTASADEKADMWPRIVAVYKGYAGYAKKTERDIPVVICEPRS